MLEIAETRPETLVTRLAAGQHGLVTTAQLLSVGWSNDVIAARARSGWLRRRHRGVYLVGPLEAPHTQAMAAVLASGLGALIAHYPAGDCPFFCVWGRGDWLIVSRGIGLRSGF